MPQHTAHSKKQVVLAQKSCLMEHGETNKTKGRKPTTDYTAVNAIVLFNVTVTFL